MNFFDLINSSPFLSSFFASLISGSIILVLGTYLFPKYLSWSRRPKIGFYLKNNDWHITNNNQWKLDVHLQIFNKGMRTIERYYWEIYINKDEYVDINPAEQNYKKECVGDYVHLYGYIQKPIFSLDYIDFPYKIRILTKEKKTYMLYYFKTDTGWYPFYSRFFIRFNKINWLKKIIIK